MKCSRCGACCQQLKLFGELYDFLHYGSGVCKYFDKTGNSCAVYAIRPVICRVNEMKALYFPHIPKEKFIADSMAGCDILRKRLQQ